MKLNVLTGKRTYGYAHESHDSLFGRLAKENLIKAFHADYPDAMVRGAKLARSLGARELRTKKNDHLAVVWDELGNAFALRVDGRRVQLIGSEYQGA